MGQRVSDAVVGDGDRDRAKRKTASSVLLLTEATEGIVGDGVRRGKCWLSWLET